MVIFFVFSIDFCDLQARFRFNYASVLPLAENWLRLYVIDQGRCTVIPSVGKISVVHL